MTTIDDPTTPITIPTADEARIARRERIRLLLRSPAFILGCVLLGIWVICAIFGELIAPQDPLAEDLLNDLAAPSSEHLFGTDRLGRDVLSRVIVGAREILIMAPLATLLGTVARDRASGSSPATTGGSSTRRSMRVRRRAALDPARSSRRCSRSWRSALRA